MNGANRAAMPPYQPISALVTPERREEQHGDRQDFEAAKHHVKCQYPFRKVWQAGKVTERTDYRSQARADITDSGNTATDGF